MIIFFCLGCNGIASQAQNDGGTTSYVAFIGQT